jgi:hypothetical protein
MASLGFFSVARLQVRPSQLRPRQVRRPRPRLQLQRMGLGLALAFLGWGWGTPTLAQTPGGNPSAAPNVSAPSVGAPNLPRSATPGSSFNPNSLTNLKITNYAKAVLEIEQVRLKFHQQATQVLGTPLPPNTCMGNYRGAVSPNLETICNSYLQEARAIVDKYRLTPEEFNGITLRSRSDTVLLNRIQQELSRWQRQRSLAPSPSTATTTRPAVTRP